MTSASRPPAPVSPMLVVAVLCFGGLTGSLSQSLVLPIQGELPELLGTDPANASWAVTATLLAGAVTMPVTGRLADMYGKKRILIAAASVLLLGSIVSALSTSLGPFLVGRALQGAAMGYIAVAISMVREVAPPHRSAAAVASVSATLGVGGALGLPLSAWIADTFSWHGLFWVTSAFALTVLLLTVFVVPGVQDAHPGRLDLAGILGLGVGLSSALIGVSKGAEWGWTSAATLGSILGGLVVLAVWAAYEMRRQDPLVDLRTSTRRPVLFTNLAAVMIGFGMMAQMIALPQLLQLPAATGFGLGQTMLQAGLWMAPGGLMMMMFAPVSSGLINGIGARLTLVIGGGVLGTGYLVAIGLMGAPWQLMIGSMISFAGVGIGYAAMPTLILDNVPAHEAGASVGVNALMRAVGTTTAGAVMAAIMTSRTVDFGGQAVPSEAAFQLCFVVGAVAAFSGGLIALLVPKRQVESAAEPQLRELPARV